MRILTKEVVHTPHYCGSSRRVRLTHVGGGKAGLFQLRAGVSCRTWFQCVGVDIYPSSY